MNASQFRMDISFIIPAHNEEKYIEACIRGAFSCKPREVVVANNGSNDSTGEILARLQMEYGNVLVVVDVPKKGVTLARQAALEKSTSKYVASVDSDCRPNADWMARMTDAFNNHPDVMCMSGPYDFYDLPRTYRFLNMIKEAVLLFVERTTHIGQSQVCGGNFIVRRDALIRAGGFDVCHAFNGEDVETERRLRRVGRVMFSRRLCIPASARRVIAEGILTSFIFPRFNRYYQLFVGKPVTSQDEKDWR